MDLLVCYYIIYNRQRLKEFCLQQEDNCHRRYAKGSLQDYASVPSTSTRTRTRTRTTRTQTFYHTSIISLLNWRQSNVALCVKPVACSCTDVNLDSDVWMCLDMHNTTLVKSQCISGFTCMLLYNIRVTTIERKRPTTRTQLS